MVSSRATSTSPKFSAKCGFWFYLADVFCFFFSSSFGQVEKSRSHLLFSGQPDQSELQKLKSLEKILNQCADARKSGDWRSALKESEAAIAAGADFSPQVELIDILVFLYMYVFRPTEIYLNAICSLLHVKPKPF